MFWRIWLKLLEGKEQEELTVETLQEPNLEQPCFCLDPVQRGAVILTSLSPKTQAQIRDRLPDHHFQKLTETANDMGTILPNERKMMMEYLCINMKCSLVHLDLKIRKNPEALLEILDDLDWQAGFPEACRRPRASDRPQWGL